MPPDMSSRLKSMLNRHREGILGAHDAGVVGGGAAPADRSAFSAGGKGAAPAVRSTSSSAGRGAASAGRGPSGTAGGGAAHAGRAMGRQVSPDPLSPVDESGAMAYGYAHDDDEGEFQEDGGDDLHQWYQDDGREADDWRYGPARGPYGQARPHRASQVITFDDAEIIHLLTEEVLKLQSLYAQAQEAAVAEVEARDRMQRNLVTEMEQLECENVFLRDQFNAASEAFAE